MSANDNGLVAQWQSKGGRSWLKLFRDPQGFFSYRSENGGGSLGRATDQSAIDEIQARIETGWFDRSDCRSKGAEYLRRVI